MRPLLKQLLCQALLLAAALFLIDRLSLVLGPDNKILDTEQATLFGETNSEKEGVHIPGALSIWSNRWEAALLGYPILAQTRTPKLIVFGGSSTEQGFRPQELQPLTPGFEVHCVGVTLGSLPDLKRLTQLTLSVMEPEVLERSVFVIGVYHSIFRGDSLDSVVPEYQHQMYPSLFPRPGAASDPLLGPASFAKLIRLLRPFYWLQFQVKRFNAERHRALSAARGPGSVPEKAQRFLDSLLRAQSDPVFEPKPYDWRKDLPAIIRFWEDAPFLKAADKSPNPAQWDILAEVVDTIRAAKATVVLVDLPVSSPHRETLRSGRGYQDTRGAHFARLMQVHGALYVDMQEEFADETFVDSVHPGAGWTRLWSAKLAQRLDGLGLSTGAGDVVK